ncbi:putative transcription factor WD40-like family [Medicago truncatula]|uniref:Putative transcription factor WD40-like family n=1 Tax=Medicago truncatula TaxID=3880 RepID=A0A396HY72_MEDTR|nr:putative transcription factor WD40-like family [Medicago truncatula]
MHNNGEIIWAKDNEIQIVDIKNAEAEAEIVDGEMLPLAVKELGACILNPQSLKHNPDGRFVAVCGDGEYIIHTALPWTNMSCGSAVEIVWSLDGEYAVRKSNSKIKIFSKTFQEKSVHPTFSAEKIFGGPVLALCSNDSICFYDWAECRLIRRIEVKLKYLENLYWNDSGDLFALCGHTSFFTVKYNCDVVSSYLDNGIPVDEDGTENPCKLLHEISERVRRGIWVEDCFIYTNSSWRLNYCVGDEVTTIFHLDRPMYLLGYLASQDRVYLIDSDFNLIKYKSLVIRGDFERAKEILPSIPKEHHNSVLRFLESRGMIEDALNLATDPEYRFGLAIQHGRLEVAKDVALELKSISKWKQLGELAMSNGKLEMAEECLEHAMDFHGLLLLHSSTVDIRGMSKLATLAKEHGKNDFAFLCLFMLGKREDCRQLLEESNQNPEAILMGRSYLPSKVSELLEKWRKDLSKVNPKHAYSLANPEEYTDLCEYWQVASAPALVPLNLIEEIFFYLPVRSVLNVVSRLNRYFNYIIRTEHFVQKHLEKSGFINPYLIMISEPDEYHYYDFPLVSVSVNSLLEDPAAPTLRESVLFEHSFTTSWGLICSCNGLLCFRDIFQSSQLCFWNPATGFKLECISEMEKDNSVYSFGFDPLGKTLKLVVFCMKRVGSALENTVKIFNLNNKSWKDVQQLPVVPLYWFERSRSNSGFHLNGSINWLALRNYSFSDYNPDHVRYITTDRYVIVSLNLSTEIYTELLLPEGFEKVPKRQPRIAVLMDQICFCHDAEGTNFIIWQMKCFGNRDSWVKLFKFGYENFPSANQLQCLDFSPVYLSQDGDKLILVRGDGVAEEAFVYYHRDNRVSRIGIANNLLWTEAMSYVGSMVYRKFLFHILIELNVNQTSAYYVSSFKIMLCDIVFLSC